jgi:hypothetical protein
MISINDHDGRFRADPRSRSPNVLIQHQIADDKHPFPFEIV